MTAVLHELRIATRRLAQVPVRHSRGEHRGSGSEAEGRLGIGRVGVAGHLEIVELLRRRQERVDGPDEAEWLDELRVRVVGGSRVDDI